MIRSYVWNHNFKDSLGEGTANCAFEMRIRFLQSVPNGEETSVLGVSCLELVQKPAGRRRKHRMMDDCGH